MPTVILQFIFLLLALDIRHVFGQSCTNLDHPAHGRVRLRARGRIAKFRCFRKYKLFGPKLVICSSGKWSLPPPVCIRKGCDEIQSSENLTVTNDQGGAVLEFKCAPPLKLTGEKLITCDGKTWSAPVPSCKYVEPGNYCDFEDENICGWQHDKLANFEWKWNSGTTPTRRTGPKYDHTMGEVGNGHYMFMESSSPIKINDKARLSSPYFPATTGGLCFEIWYHMWGVHGYNQVGRLKIYIEDKIQSDTLSQKAEFNVSGNQGDEWIKGRFPVGERNTPFRIIIEGTLKSYLSDISVDDPKLYNCSDDYTDSTLGYQETTAIDTTESVVQTTTMYHRPIETTEPSSSVTSVTHLVKTTKEFAASPTDYTESTRSYQEKTAPDTTESVVQPTTMHHRPFETTKASSSLATLVTRLVTATKELATFPTDFTDNTHSNQETAPDTTEPVAQTTSMYHKPFETTEASSSLATSVTRLVKTTEDLAAPPTDYMDTRRNQEITSNNTTEAVIQTPTQTVLMIGIGVGIVITLMIVTSAIYAQHKKRRKQDVFEYKEEPIARKYLFEIYKYGKDSDMDYHFET
ncbi:zonadhesin-like [Mytilus edulis]|uniref:zonadhesin-like n=1 Tax=Mytilus edulis TaxID=6550 RepID=UPI0039EE3D1C